MKNKLFDFKFYKQGLKQLRMIGIMSFVILMLQAVLVPMTIYVTQQAEKRVEVVKHGFDTVHAELANYQPLLYLVGIIILPLMVRSLFEFMNKRNASDFYHSLPVTRTCMYISYLAAVLTWYLFLFFVPSLVFCVLIHLPEGYVLVTDTMPIFFCSVTTLGLLISSALLVAMGLTGTRFTNTAVAFMILFLPRAYIMYFKGMVSSISDYILFSPNSILWNNSRNLLFSLFTGGMDNWSSILYTFVLSLLYLVIAGVLFKTRKSEKADQVAISPKMQMVIRIIPSLTFCFIPMALIVSFIEEVVKGEGNAGQYLFELLFYLVSLYLIAAVIYFLYELITTKKLRMIVKAIPGLLVLFVMNAVIIALIYAYSFFASCFKPTADQIEYIQILRNGYSYGYGKDYYEECVSDIHWKDERLNALIADSLRYAVSGTSPDAYYQLPDIYEEDGFSYYRDHVVSVEVAIHYDGITIYRNLDVYDEDGVIQSLYDTQPYYDAYYQFPDAQKDNCSFTGYGYDYLHDTSIDDTEEQRKRMYAGFLRDVADMTPKEWYDHYNFSSYEDTVYTLKVRFLHDFEWYTISIPITEDMPHAYAVYEQMLENESWRY